MGSFRGKLPLYLIGAILVASAACNVFFLLNEDLPPQYDSAKVYKTGLDTYYWLWQKAHETGWTESAPVLPPEVSFLRVGEDTPPLVPLLMSFFMFVFGRSQDVARFVNLPFLALGAFALYGLVKRVAGALGGVVAAFAFCTAPIVIGAGRASMLDLPVAGVVAFNLCVLMTSTEDGRPRWFLWTISWVLGLLTSSSFLFFVWMPNLVYIWRLIQKPIAHEQISSRKVLSQIGLSLFLLFVGLVAWSVMLKAFGRSMDTGGNRAFFWSGVSYLLFALVLGAWLRFFRAIREPISVARLWWKNLLGTDQKYLAGLAGSSVLVALACSPWYFPGFVSGVTKGHWSLTGAGSDQVRFALPSLGRALSAVGAIQLHQLHMLYTLVALTAVALVLYRRPSGQQRFEALIGGSLIGTLLVTIILKVSSPYIYLPMLVPICALIGFAVGRLERRASIAAVSAVFPIGLLVLLSMTFGFRFIPYQATTPVGEHQVIWYRQGHPLQDGPALAFRPEQQDWHQYELVERVAEFIKEFPAGRRSVSAMLLTRDDHLKTFSLNCMCRERNLPVLFQGLTVMPVSHSHMISQVLGSEFLVSQSTMGPLLANDFAGRTADTLGDSSSIMGQAFEMSDSYRLPDGTNLNIWRNDWWSPKHRPLKVCFGRGIELVTYAEEYPTIYSDSVLPVHFLWRINEAPTDGAETFLHLHNSEGAMVAAHHATPPKVDWSQASYPYEYHQTIPLYLPSDVKPDAMKMKLGWWIPDEGTRLPVMGAEESEPGAIALPSDITLAARDESVGVLEEKKNDLVLKAIGTEGGVWLAWSCLDKARTRHIVYRCLEDRFEKVAEVKGLAWLDSKIPFGTNLQYYVRLVSERIGTEVRSEVVAVDWRSTPLAPQSSYGANCNSAHWLDEIPDMVTEMDERLKQLREAGFGTVRFFLDAAHFWHPHLKLSAPYFYDVLFALIRRNGLRAHVSLFNPPNPSFYVDGVPETNWENWTFDNYMTALGEVLNRYGDCICVFEIDNEPDDGLRWTDRMDDPNVYNPASKSGSRFYSPIRYRLSDGALYAELYISAAEKIRACSPDITIISGSTAGFTDEYKTFIGQFLEEMNRRGAVHLCDGIGIHPYRGKFAPELAPRSSEAWGYGDRHRLSDVTGIVAAIAESRGIAAPTVWITEFGYLTNQGADTAHGLSAEKQADFLMQSIFVEKAMRPAAAVMNIYSDMDAGTRMSENYGMRYKDGRFKPAWDSVKFALQYASEWEADGPMASIEVGERTVWTVPLKQDASKALAVWTSGYEMPMTLPLPQGYNQVMVTSWKRTPQLIEVEKNPGSNQVTLDLCDTPAVLLLRK